MLSSTLGALNNNKITLAVTMIVVNLGSRYALSDITPAHERLLSHIFFKRFVIFCMFFVATRDVVTSIILTAAFLFVFNVLLSESSEYCILPTSLRSSNGISVPPSTPISRPPMFSSPSPPATQAAQEQWLRDRAAEKGRLKENMTTNIPLSSKEEPTAAPAYDEVAWAQEILRRNGETAFRFLETGDDYQREMVSPPPPPPETDNIAFAGAEDDGEAELSLEEKLQKRMAERGAAFSGTAGSTGSPPPSQEEEDKKSSGEPVPYSGGGCLYEDTENDCDITRSTTLSYVHFDENAS